VFPKLRFKEDAAQVANCDLLAIVLRNSMNVNALDYCEGVGQVH
jgi:hypothetical protein